MANFGRFVCVALPFLLTLASLISLLVAGLAGVVGNRETTYIFRVNLTDLQVKPNVIASIVGRSPEPLPQAAPLVASASSHFHEKQASTASNITAADLGLNKIYDVNLWGYCFQPQQGDRSCLPSKFNWAESEINQTISNIKKLGQTAGKNVTLPKEVVDALNTFATVTRWTEVVFIIAGVALGVAMALGIIANCSRAVSCLTWVVSGVATGAVLAFAGLATATATVVVGTAESTAKVYGVRANFHTGFLATVWLSAAFALGASIFWLFTVCCCKPDRSSSKRNSGKKHVPAGSYTPLGDNGHQGAFPQNNSGYYNNNNQYGGPRRNDMAYEPYSHSR